MGVIRFRQRLDSKGVVTWRAGHGQGLIWVEEGLDAYRTMQERLGDTFKQASRIPKGLVLIPSDPLVRPGGR